MQTYNLKAGYILTVVTDDLTTANYCLIDSIGTGPLTTVAVSSTVSIGPFTDDRRYGLIVRGAGYTVSTAFAAVASSASVALKADKASPTFTGTVTIPTPFTLGAVSVLPTGTELNFVDGVTSSIQTQLNGRALVGATVIAPLDIDADGTEIAAAVNGIITALIAAGILAIA
jgi:hypothetical protein